MIIYYGVDCPVLTGLRIQIPQLVKSSLNFSVDQNEQRHNFHFCPAHIEHNKNLFYVPALFDYNLWYDKEHDFYRTDYYNQEVFDKFIDVRVSRMKLLAFLMPVYILTESNDLEISQLPAYFHANEFTKNTITIPGTFNVGKWPRPLDFSFCLLDKIEIKEGDPLYYIKFNTKEPINFKRFIVSDLYKKYIFN